VTLLCATTNPGKLREFALAGREFGVDIRPLPHLRDLPACEETGVTFEENAVLKAKYYGAQTAGLLFAEDSGLEVDALGGAPGVRSARFAGANASDRQNNDLLLERMEGRRNRAARFVAVAALADGGRLVRTFRGAVEGLILEQPRGGEGFGYDPLFYYPAFGCSFGEVPRERKLTVSHRGQALRALLAWVCNTCTKGGIDQ
jgi:XTP/dITP diphosphohydrolase